MWSGIRRLTALAGLPKRVSGGREALWRLSALSPWRGSGSHTTCERALTSLPDVACPTWSVRWGNGHYCAGVFILGLRELFRVCLAQSEQQTGTTSRPELHISRSLYYSTREEPPALPFVCLAPASQLSVDLSRWYTSTRHRQTARAFSIPNPHPAYPIAGPNKCLRLFYTPAETNSAACWLL